MDSIFDDVIEETIIKPPIAVLKELALALEKRTGGLLEGKAQQEFYSDQFTLNFYIVAPSLNNYSYHVFSISHDLGFYPLSVHFFNSKEIIDLNSKKIINQEELEAELKTIFSSPDVKKVMNGLLAQIKAA
jgi:hypothetical protein